jgi:hypothetical protein
MRVSQSFGMILYHVITGLVPMSQEEKESKVTLSELIIRVCSIPPGLLN